MAEAVFPLEQQPQEEAIRRQLYRILASQVFARSERLSRFLRYTVEHSLQGLGDQLKESVIGVEVYDRTSDYNPKIDPIVRNEARRLRAKLHQYYEGEGRSDAIRIDYPKGSYAPVFRSREPTQPASNGSARRPVTSGASWKYTAALMAGLALALAALWAIRGGGTARLSGTMPAVEPLSVAVLPFVNLSGDPANEYFVDGLTEELIDTLTKVDGLRVPARTSAFAFKGKGEDIREIGSKLNARMVLEGSVRKSGDKLRITAQLNKVADGYHLWSETYDLEMKDALAIQSRIARAIAATLKLKLADAGEATGRAGNAEAYRLYLKGRYFLSQPAPASWKKAVAYFTQATDNDPGYALAYAGLSNAWLKIGIFDPAQPPEAFPDAEAAARKALALDDALSEAHGSLASLSSEKWDWADAEREFRRAIELNPNNAHAHQSYAAGCLALTGRLDQAIQELKRAQDLDPIARSITGTLGEHLYYARRYDEAMEQSRKALELNPNAFGAQNMLGRCYVQKGMLADAVAEFQKTEAISPGHMFWSASLAGLHVKKGQRAEADKLLEKWKGRSSRELHYPLVMAMLYEGLGDMDKAFRWLEIGYREHDTYLPWIKISPEFDDLRSDSRFHALLKKMGLS